MVLCLHVRFFFYYYVWWCDICVCNVWWCDICVLCLTWFSVYMCGFFFYLHIHQPHHVFFFGIFFFFFLVSCPRYRKRATSRHLKTRLNNPLERRKNSFFFSWQRYIKRGYFQTFGLSRPGCDHEHATIEAAVHVATVLMEGMHVWMIKKSG